MSRKKRVFIGLHEVAGYYRNLRHAIRSAGYETTLVDLYGHHFDYGGHDNQRIFFAETVKRMLEKRRQIPLEKRWQRYWNRVKLNIAQWILFLGVLFKHDVFIMGFNSTFFMDDDFSFSKAHAWRYTDLRIMKWLKKRVICISNGSDSNPPYLDGHSLYQKMGALQLIELTRTRRAMIRSMERYADVMVTYPARAHFYGKRFVSHPCMGIPYPALPDLPKPLPRENNAIRILHAPSNPRGKGTPAIRQTIKELKTRYDIDYVELQGVPNRVVLEELAKTDLVIDQIYSVSPIAGLAVEAGFLEKPVVICSRVVEDIKKIYPHDMLPPTCLYHPDDLKDAVEKLIQNPILRQDHGREFKIFLEKKYTAEAVGSRYARVIEDDIPAHWLIEPESQCFTMGWGLTVAEVGELVRKMVQFGGVSSLGLSDKKDLESRFHAMAKNTEA